MNTISDVNIGGDLAYVSRASGMNGLHMLTGLIRNLDERTVGEWNKEGENAELLGKSDMVIVGVPGFQQAPESFGLYRQMANQRNIPLVIPEGFPTGLDAVMYSQPEKYIEAIINYVGELKIKYPNLQKIVLHGHSLGGMLATIAFGKLKQAHKDLDIHLVTQNATLQPLPTAQGHLAACLFPQASDMMSGRSGHIQQAQEIFRENQDQITIIQDSSDGWIKPHEQVTDASLSEGVVLEITGSGNHFRAMDNPKVLEQILGKLSR